MSAPPPRPLPPPLLWVNLRYGLFTETAGVGLFVYLFKAKREKERDLPSTEAQFTMIVLAFSTGSRLDFVSQSRVFFLQTFLWIFCATVCKAEQYFNVEVRSAVCVCAFPSPFLPFPSFSSYPLNKIKSNQRASQPRLPAARAYVCAALLSSSR